MMFVEVVVIFSLLGWKRSSNRVHDIVQLELTYIVVTIFVLSEVDLGQHTYRVLVENQIKTYN